MIVLIGIKKNTDLNIREKLSIDDSKYSNYLEELLNFFEEAVIINTCNRVEIYLNSNLELKESVDKVFSILAWNKNLEDNCFVFYDEKAISHLFDVVSGFHSRITGEDQILGQVKSAYKKSVELVAVKSVLNRLFQNAIGCGKKFRTMSKLYEIPISSASIAVNKAVQNHAKKIIIIGFGDVGKLVYKYAISLGIEDIIIIVRNKSKIAYMENEKIKIKTYEEAKPFLNHVDAIISCTSSRDIIVKKFDINKFGEQLQIFDLAVPRDVDEDLDEFSRISLYNIDDISKIDDINKINRKKRMYEYKYILNEAIYNFLEWLNLREISKDINEFRNFSSQVIKTRCETFYNKSKNKDDIKLANKMIKSTSDIYVNKAIEVLKEEKLKGNEEECLRILKMIFS